MNNECKAWKYLYNLAYQKLKQMRALVGTLDIDEGSHATKMHPHEDSSEVANLSKGASSSHPNDDSKSAMVNEMARPKKRVKFNEN